MPPLVLTDEHVNRYLTPTESVAVMEQVFLARANGHYSGMPRWELPFKQGAIRFTVGGGKWRGGLSRLPERPPDGA